MKLLDVLSAPWAIIPEKKLEIDNIYATRLRGEKIDLREVEAAIGRPLDNSAQAYEVRSGVAVIPMDGVVAKRMNIFTRISGGTSTQLLGEQIQQALDDPTVTAILLHIDSPGGSVDGVQELADLIFQARDQKPIVAVADGMMASAAYWIGSSTSRVYVTSGTTIVGSIGVLSTHVDVSGAEAKAGMKTTEVTAGKYKRIASSYAPLTQEGRQNMQDQVDYVYGVFLSDVARNRGAESTDAVHDSMADGRLFIGQQAVDAGLVDGVATLDQVIAMLAEGEIDLGASTNARSAVPGRRADAGPTTQSAAGDAAGTTSTTQEIPMADNNNKTPAAPAPITAQDAQPFVDQALATARTEFEASLTTARSDAAAAERARIQAVFEQSMPGHETLVRTLAFDGKTSGPEAAVQVLNAERTKRAKVGADLAADAPAPAPIALVPDTGKAGASEGDSGMTMDAKDIHENARKARAYIVEQEKQGNRVSVADAMRHVTKKGA